MSPEDFAVTLKPSSSPLTRADTASHHLITEKLKELSDLPVLSEESKTILYEERAQWEIHCLWIPWMGPKNLSNAMASFTVNIALIQNGTPILGVIHASTRDLTYYALRGEGAFRHKEENSQ